MSKGMMHVKLMSNVSGGGNAFLSKVPCPPRLKKFTHEAKPVVDMLGAQVCQIDRKPDCTTATVGGRMGRDRRLITRRQQERGDRGRGGWVLSEAKAVGQVGSSTLLLPGS